MYRFFQNHYSEGRDTYHKVEGGHHHNFMYGRPTYVVQHWYTYITNL
jgi:hypothetical protein